MTESPSFAAARALYFTYDGSRFFMSRDGVEQEYLSHGVPTDLEAQWRDELTAERLAFLQSTGDWRVLYYFVHGPRPGHALAALTAPVANDERDQVIYLDLLSDYLRRCPADELANADVRASLRAVIARATRLRSGLVPDAVRDRLDGALERLDAFVPPAP